MEVALRQTGGTDLSQWLDASSAACHLVGAPSLTQDNSLSREYFMSIAVGSGFSSTRGCFRKSSGSPLEARLEGLCEKLKGLVLKLVFRLWRAVDSLNEGV
jgi:hypothetical protein